jgi:hypothetical protein
MNFLYPAFLIGALAVAVPIVLHLLRRDVAPEVRFSAVRLLKKSPVERSRRRRLRDLLLLAARVAALLLLAAAFARPFAQGATSANLPIRILAVDRSFSMSAPGAFDRAMTLARQAVDEAGFGERIAVIAFDDRAQVLAQPGGQGEARAALARIRPGEGATRYAAALAQATELAAGSSGRLILISDLQRAGWEGESRVRVPASLQLETRDVGQVPSNVFLADARVGADGVTATIRNASSVPGSGLVTLSRDGKALTSAAWKAAPHESVDVALAWTPTAGPLTVSTTEDAGYAADNARHLLVGDATEPSVVIVASPDAPGLYLRQALAAAEDTDAGLLRPRVVTAAEIAGGRAEAITRGRALVILSTRGLDRAARDAMSAFVSGGGGVLIAASTEVDPNEIAAIFNLEAGAFRDAPSRAASLTVTDGRHPIFRPFGAFAANLGGIRFDRAWIVDGTGWNVAARFDDGTPAVLDRRVGSGRAVLFASDLDRRWNDFPLHPTFVPFVAETLRHVSARSSGGGSFVVGRVPAGLPSTAGVHRLDSGRTIVVNVDTRESAATAMTADEFSAMVEPVDDESSMPRLRAEQTEARQNLWQYGLLLMLGALVAESFVGRRG